MVEAIDVDRVDPDTVLLDLWRCEHRFQKRKRDLIDLYLYIYDSIADVQDKAKIAQQIVDVIYSRPFLDLNEE